MSPGEDKHHAPDERTVTETIERPEFRTTVASGEVTVTGVLPAVPRPDTARTPAAWIAIAGDVQHLSCDDALELVDALLLVVMRMDGVADGRG